MKRKRLTNLVCDLALATEADVIVLNECSAPISTTLHALNAEVDEDFIAPNSSDNDRFHCFFRNPDFDLTQVHKGFRTSIRRLRFGSVDVLLGLVHGVDIRNYDSETRQSVAQDLATEVRFVKDMQGHNRMILMGDFNMNPYERGMNLAMGLNAMMTRACVTSGHRKFLNKNYDLYYNPMWSLFGDGSEGPPGTVYDASSQGPYGWSMLDQVVINSSILRVFQSVRILTQAGSNSLIDTKGRPDAGNASDHLPILLKLKEIDHD